MLNSKCKFVQRIGRCVSVFLVCVCAYGNIVLGQVCFEGNDQDMEDDVAYTERMKNHLTTKLEPLLGEPGAILATFSADHKFFFWLGNYGALLTNIFQE